MKPPKLSRKETTLFSIYGRPLLLIPKEKNHSTYEICKESSLCIRKQKEKNIN